MRVLMIDNYDSFTYNLVQYLQELGAEVLVHRNDKIDLAGMEALNADRLMISPGPCTPNEACLLYTSPSPRDGLLSRMPSSA